MEKKGQVTLIIIIGILILFVSAGILFAISKISERKLIEEKTEATSKVPEEFNPIISFTEECLRKVVKEGLILLGQQGGYIYPSLFGEFSEEEPTESDGLLMGSRQIPYWWYNKISNKENKIKYASLQPELHLNGKAESAIEWQLAKYAEENLDGCLNDYSQFKEKGYSIEEGEKKVKVFLGKLVHSQLNFPLKISKEERFSHPEVFSVTLPIDFEHFYQIADLITEAEKNFSFLEREILEMMHIYSGVGQNKLPPMTETTFEFVGQIWLRKDVKENLQGLLVSYTPMLRYLGSLNFGERFEYPKSEYSDLYQKIYDNTIIPLYGAEDLEVRFDYFNWEPYFDINSKGEIIQPTNLFITFPLIGVPFTMNQYYTVYDLSWPVIISIRDPKAFGGEGYSFVFALEANIRNNRPAEDNETLPAPIAAFSQSMVCDPDKQDAGPIKALVVDSFDEKPLEAVQLSFTIPEQDTCLMGLTDEDGELIKDFPAVYGGVLNLMKEGYLTTYYALDTYGYKKPLTGSAVKGIESPVELPEIKMHKIKTINASVQKKNLGKCINFPGFGIVGTPTYIPPWTKCYGFEGFGFQKEEVFSFDPKGVPGKHLYYFLNSAKKLSPNEQAIITLKRVGDSEEGSFQQEWVTAVTITGDASQEIQLVPGLYEVTGVLILNEEVVIPEDERCFCPIPIGCPFGWGEECFTINETIMEKYPGGNLQWDEEKYYIKITPDDLYTSDKVVFYVLNHDIKSIPAEAEIRIIEDLQVLGEMANLSKKLRSSLEPRFE